MMLTSDAFLSGAGEMDRLRASSLSQSANPKKANTETQVVTGGESFPEVLKSIQESADNADVSGTAAEASDVSNAAALAEEKGSGTSLEAAVSKKEGAEEEPADALYANLLTEAAVAAANAPIADDVLLEAGEGDSPSSIIAAITADIEDESTAPPSLIAEGSEEEAAAVLDERESLAKSATATEARIDADKNALDVNLSSINVDENEAAVASSNADELEEAFADIGNLAQAGESKVERTSLAQESAQGAVAVGQGKAESSEEAAAITVADFRTEARASADKANVASRNNVDAKDTETSATIALANSQGTDAAQSSADASFEGDGLLGKEGFNAGSSFSLQGARGGEGAANGTQGAGASFAERLASELRNNAADIVRAGQIILRNGGEGTIRLALHPETLGAVRIHLEMTGEKKIAGRITVSSREAWDAFSDSMDSLVAAFADEGFDTAAGFDLSWAGRGAGGEAGALSAPFYASAIPEVMLGEELTDDYNRAAAKRSAGSLYSVDLFA